MFTTTKASAGRGCGERDEEAAYCCCGVGSGGMPIEHFIVDPCIPWPGRFQRGVKILPRHRDDPNSINDLVIFVGRESYPAAFDFVEEARRYGASRKMPPTLPWEKLTPYESRMIFVHSLAIPKFIFTLNRDEVPLPGCKLKDAPGWEHCDAGEHPYIEKRHTCTFALSDLAELSHPEAEPDGWRKYGFKIKMPSFDYLGVYPAGPHEAPPLSEW